MADSNLKRKIRDMLRHGLFKDEDDYVYVADGEADEFIHIKIISFKFEHRNMRERHDLIWSELAGNLSPEEWGKVSLSVGISPEELKALI